MFFRAADGFYRWTGPAQWQQVFQGIGVPDPGTSLPLGFEGPPALADDVPMPTGVAPLLIRTSQELSALATFAAAPILADESPRRRAPVKLPPPETVSAPPLPILSLHVLDAPAPMPRPLAAMRVPIETALPPLAVGLAEPVADQQPARAPAPLYRLPAEWTPPARTTALDDVQPPRVAPRAARPPVDSWSAPPLPVVGEFVPDQYPVHRQPPVPQRPEAWGSEPLLQPIAEVPPDQLPPVRPPAPRRPPLEDATLAVAASDPPADSPPPRGAPPPRHQLPPVEQLPALTAPPALAAWFGAPDTRPQPWRRPPIFDSQTLDALPKLGVAPLDLPPARPQAKFRPPPIFDPGQLDALVATLREFLGDLPPTPPQPRRKPWIPDDVVAELARLAPIQADLLIVPRRQSGPPRLPDPEVLSRLVSQVLADQAVMPRHVRAAVVPFEDALPALRLSLLGQDDPLPPAKWRSIAQQLAREIESLDPLVNVIPLPVALSGSMPTSVVGIALATTVLGTTYPTGAKNDDG